MSEKLGKEELLKELDTMLILTIADMYEHGEDEETYEKIINTYKQSRQIIEEHFEKPRVTKKEAEQFMSAFINMHHREIRNLLPGDRIPKCVDYSDFYRWLKSKNIIIEEHFDRPRVTRKDVFDFQDNLFTINEDSESGQESYDREFEYIINWLKSKNITVED